MANFNLSDAAKNILLGEDSKSIQTSTTSGKRPEGGKLPTSVVAGQQDVGKIGDAPQTMSDANPNYTAGTPSATPPGATPPVGSEPMKKLAPQPGEGSGMTPAQAAATDYAAIRDRIAGKRAAQMMMPNPGATFQSYGEESEYEDEEVIEEGKEDNPNGQTHSNTEPVKPNLALTRAVMRAQKHKQEKMKEDMDALLSGEDLSEEFVTKATTIFEAAVIARAEEVISEAEEQLMEEFEIAVEAIKEDLASKVDGYLNYMVEEWMKDNEIAIQSGLKAEITEEFLTGLRDLFIEHNIDIPEDKVDIVEELAAQLEATEAVLNEEIVRGIELSQALNEQKKIEAIYTACEGLTQTQVEKMKSLAEGVDFTTEYEFTTKLDTLKESYFRANVKVATTDALDDEVLLEEEKRAIKSSNSEIDYYAKSISQTLVK